MLAVDRSVNRKSIIFTHQYSSPTILEYSSEKNDEVSWSKRQIFKYVRLCSWDYNSIRCEFDVKRFDVERSFFLNFTTFANVLMKLVIEWKFFFTVATLIRFVLIAYFNFNMIIILVEKIIIFFVRLLINLIKIFVFLVNFFQDKNSEWWFWDNQKEEEHFFEDVNSMY
jgi:hypothetical protein